MSSVIHIKRRTRLPWNNNSSCNSSSTTQPTISNVTSLESKNNNYLKTSDFSNLSEISVGTPPSYSVYENSEGEMVNEREGVKWPERPLTGYHSLKEYKKRKAFIEKNIKEQKNSNKDDGEKTDPVDILNNKQNDKNKSLNNFPTSCVTTGKCADMGFCNMPNININKSSTKINYLKGSDVKQTYVFCGVKTEEEIKSLIQGCDIFYIFYDNNTSDGKILFEVPLKIAYFDQKKNEYIIKNACRKYVEHTIDLPQSRGILSRH